MKRGATLTLSAFGAAMVVATALFTPACTCGPARLDTKPTHIERVTYHGWKDAVRMSNERTEVVIVPQIGRVISFRFIGSTNVFWEDRSLDGKQGDPSGKEWVNFGGDKTWPAPEAEWSNYTGWKQWMPPPAFDSLPMKASIERNTVVLTSPVDPYYGIRIVRRIRLQPVYAPAASATLRITTEYERVKGEPSKIAVWVITQFTDPVAVYVPVKTNSIFQNGYYAFKNEPWSQLRREANYIVITRDPNTPHKMGSDARAAVWVGKSEVCVITSQSSGTEYPDRGASIEIYTNPDPKQYVELETLGPLSLLPRNGRITNTQTYSLHPRKDDDIEKQFPWLFR